MPSAVCTLFEGNYHYGVAALANSLYANGYKGEIYAGYRGALTGWCAKAQSNTLPGWPDARTLEVDDNFKIHFLPLSTDYHFTNYKPDFMINLWESAAKDTQAMYYFDPDIVVTQKWNFFKEWVNYGIALCEDVNSPLPEYHPRRMAWREHYIKNNIQLSFKEATYANGGFVGIHSRNKDFLNVWKQVQEIMAPLFGGLSRSSFEGESFSQEFTDYHYPFSRTDQDALNAAAEAYQGKISFVGQEAMAFKSGACLLPHALGPSKPWNINVFLQLLDGRCPRLVDREYWQYAKQGPIIFHPQLLVHSKILAVKIAAFIGRFYTR